MSQLAVRDDLDAIGGLVRVVVPVDHCTQGAYRKGVSRRLRMARVVLDLSQQEVAEASGCSRNFVSAVERGVQGMDAYRLSLIATAFGIVPILSSTATGGRTGSTPPVSANEPAPHLACGPETFGQRRRRGFHVHHAEGRPIAERVVHLLIMCRFVASVVVLTWPKSGRSASNSRSNSPSS